MFPKTSHDPTSPSLFGPPHPLDSSQPTPERLSPASLQRSSLSGQRMTVDGTIGVEMETVKKAPAKRGRKQDNSGPPNVSACIWMEWRGQGVDGEGRDAGGCRCGRGWVDGARFSPGTGCASVLLSEGCYPLCASVRVWGRGPRGSRHWYESRGITTDCIPCSPRSDLGKYSARSVSVKLNNLVLSRRACSSSRRRMPS